MPVLRDENLKAKAEAEGYGMEGNPKSSLAVGGAGSFAPAVDKAPVVEEYVDYVSDTPDYLLDKIHELQYIAKNVRKLGDKDASKRQALETRAAQLRKEIAEFTKGTRGKTPTSKQVYEVNPFTSEDLRRKFPVG